MTIKRRIFLSNLLMIALTIAIGAIVFFTARFVMLDEDSTTRGGTGGRFIDAPHIPLVSTEHAEELFEAGVFAHIDTVSLYRSDLGDFIILLPEAQFAAVEDFMQTPNFVLPMIIVYLLIVALLGNVLLAKYITRRIMTPINTLADGVREITSGNLTHRIHYQGGDEFDAVCADFNEMAARLREMVEQKQADENSRKELIAGISHDLRTPLTSVKAYLEGLRKGLATTPEMQEKYLSIIEEKTDDIEYMMKQLFLFSKIDLGAFPLNLETVDIGEKLSELFARFADEYQEMGLKLILKENTNANVRIDTVQFKHILENILGNCVKYCDRGDARAEISCKQTGNDQLSIVITDNGPGVPEEMLKKMFDVFYRGDQARNNPAKGSGLGLAISSKIVARFGGTMTAQNGADGGLAMIITLPIQKGANEA